MKKKSKSIAFRLTVYLLTGAFIIFIIMMIMNYIVSSKVYLNSAVLTAEITQGKVFDKIEMEVSKLEHVTEQLKSVLEAETSLSFKDIEPLLKNFVNEYKRISGSAFILDVERENEAPYFLYMYYSGIHDTILISHDKEFLKKSFPIPVNLEISKWSEPHLDPIDGKEKLISFLSPLKRNNKLAGVLTADILLSRLDSLLSAIKVYETGFAFLISNDGILLTQPFHKDLIMSETIQDLAKMEELKMNKEVVDGILNDIRQRKGGMVEITESYIFKNEAILIYRPLNVLNGTVLIVIPKDEALKGLYRFTLIWVGIGLVSFILLVIIIYFIIKRNLAPLQELTNSVRKVGDGDFDVTIPEPKRLDEIGKLSQAFKSMKENLRKHIILLDKSTSEINKIESEILVAAKILKNILPHSIPKGLEKTDIDIYGELKPAKQIGGDLYDYFLKENRYLYFIIGDVTGKGIPSSVFMGMTRAYFRSEGKYQQTSAELVNKINLNLFTNNPEAIFVTLFCGILDVHTGNIDFCNAGHNFPFLIKNDQTVMEIRNQHGPPAGLVEDQNYKSDSLSIEPGEVLVLYTDGVTEARNENDELYGEERLRDSILEVKDQSLSPRDICEHVLNKNKKFNGDTPQDDDITVLCLRKG